MLMSGRQHNVERIFPLTPMQEGMLFYCMERQNAEKYFEQISVKIKNKIDVAICRECLRIVSQKHEMLRAAIVYRNVTAPRQLILAGRVIDMQEAFLVGGTEEESRQVEQIKAADRSKGFDLEKDTLMRVTLIHLDDVQSEMVWSFHHIIMDGWCVSIVLSDFIRAYKQLVSGETSVDILLKQAAASPRGIYENYVKWLKKQDSSRAMTYWKQLLDGFESDVRIRKNAIVNKKDMQIASAACTEEIYLDKDMTDKLQEVVKRYHVTMSVVLETAWGIIIQKYTYNDDVVFGKVISGRNAPIEGIEDVTGLFINTIPVRMKGSGKISELLTAMARQGIESLEYGYSSLAEIQSALGQIDMIQSIVAFENYYTDDAIYNKAESFLQFEMADTYEETNYSLNLVAALSDTLKLKILYLRNCYDRSFVRNLLQQTKSLLHQICTDPEKEAAKCSVLSEEERNKILYSFNDTITDYPSEASIQQLFEENAELSPKKPAIVCEGESLSYVQANRFANRLASRLLKMGLKQEECVAVTGDKKPELILAILAVLKAGGTYVPIDYKYPEHRIRYMLKDCKCRFILSTVKLTNQVYHGYEILDLMEISLENEPESNPLTDVDGDHAAYVIYTSGSTGEPRGVLVTHRNVVRLVRNTDFFDFNDVIVLQMGTVAFDASTFEIWGPLLNGGTLCLYQNEDLMNVRKLKSAIESNGVNTMWLTAQLFNEIVNEDAHALGDLKHLLIGGERLSNEHVNIFLTENPAVHLYNGYGPTENTTFSTVYPISGTMHDIPIGRPISNSTAYVINNGSLCGIGMIGELWVGGDGLAREYLNNPELTAAKFVNASWDRSMRLYRTGDLACWRADGTISYMGRIDEQVKIRGFRIEPGEIEHVVQQQANISRCVVVPIRNGINIYLCAYFSTDIEIDKAFITSLKNALRDILPEYMMPSAFIPMERIPVTANGKVDKRALPIPVEEDFESRDYAAPKTEMQVLVTEIFEKVLERTRIGIYDNFFEIGGHSLRAGRVVNMLEKATGVRLALRDFFALATASGIAGKIEEAVAQKYESIPVQEKKEYYTTSSMQRRIYLLNQMAEENTAYNMPGGLHLQGELDIVSLKEAFGKLIECHEILRTGFHIRNGQIVQKVYDHVNTSFVTEKVENMDEIDMEACMSGFVRPFRLDHPPLIRMMLFTDGTDKHLLLFDMHHIISDGMSMLILVRQLLELYEGKRPVMPGPQYKDFCVWMEQKDQSAQKEYWLKEFEGDIPVLEMHTDFPRGQIQSFKGSLVSFSIDKGSAENIKNFCIRMQVTEFMFMMACAMALLAKYSNQEDIVIGTPVAGRNHADTLDMLGMFVNTLAMRGKPEKNKAFQDFLKEIREKTLRVFEHQEYPLDELVEALDLKGDMARNPLFDVTFAFQNNEAAVISMDKLIISQIPKKDVSAKFDLTIEVYDKRDGYEINMEYCSDLFEQETILEFGRNYINLMKNVLENPGQRLQDISVMDEELLHIMLEAFNSTELDIGVPGTINELFEEQAALYPDHIAVSMDEHSYTYKQLNEKANGLAWTLAEKGLQKGEYAAVLMNRSPDMIVALLAILKVGAAYIPMDISHPADRVEYIIHDAGIRYVLINTEEVVRVEGVTYLNTDTDTYPSRTKSPDVKTGPLDIAYAIYTSGTTGKPKGVMIRHIGVQNLMIFFREKYNISQEDVVLQFASLCFDASVFEIAVSLLTGGRLCMPSKDIISDIKKFNSFLEKEKVSVMLLPPQYAIQIENYGVRLFITGGSAAQREAVMKNCGRSQFMNAYGPTEATVMITQWTYDTEGICPVRIPIGKPIINTKIYVLADNTLCGIRMPGELCVSGIGLAAGYLNNSELTTQKFVKNPVTGELMYRTGDLVRWTKDGNIEYLGRIDEQVKIRGFRIELSEIENVIDSCGLVGKSVVITKADASGDLQICAYYEAEKAIEENAIRQVIKDKLPAYMMPSCFCQLGEIPYNSSGKVNKKKLPKPPIKECEFGEPESVTETTVAAAFQEILKIERVGVQDDFFALGGHSLNAMLVINHIEEKCGIRLFIKELFMNPSVKALGRLLDAKKAIGSRYIPKAAAAEYYPMSSAQKRIYFVSQIDRIGTVYNMPVAILIHGAVDEGKLRDVFAKMLQRNELLRTIFLVVDGEPVQKILDTVAMDFVSENKDDPEYIKNKGFSEFVRPFSLEQAPLFRMKLVKLPHGENVLMFDMHHIIGDGFGMNVIIHEFMDLYQEKDLPEITVQYKDYAVWSRSRDLKPQREYWLKEYEEQNQPLELFLDYSRPQISSFCGNNVWGSVTVEVKAALLVICEKYGITEFMVLLSAYMILLSKYSRQQDIVVGTPVSGRITKETERMMGVFINTLPIRSNVIPEETCTDFLLQIKEKCINAFDNQEYPLEELIDELDVPRENSRNPIFDVMFALQNNENVAIDIPGLNMEYVSSSIGTAKFDLTLNVVGTEKGYQINFEYSTDLFMEETVRLMLKHYTCILKDMAMNPDKSIRAVQMMDQEEKELVTNTFNKTAVKYPSDKSVGSAFEEQAKRYPDAIALVHHERNVTYRELNEMANQIADKLLQAGVKTGDSVAFLSDKSVEMIAGILATVKVGGVYVPIYTSYPRSRIQFILEDCSPKVIFTEPDELIYDTDAIVFNIRSEGIYGQNTQNPNVSVASDDLIYLIFTSGTTGNPKGAMIKHRNVMRLVKNTTYLPLNRDTVISQSGDISFDASTLEIWGALLNGGKLCLIENEVLLDAKAFKAEVNRVHINTMWLTAALFNQLVLTDATIFDDLDYLLTGGEKLSEWHVRMFKEVNRRTVLYNGYGPTENTTFTTTYVIPDEFERMYIGKPIDNTRVYILNGDELCGIGVCGELCTAGDGLGSGYLNRPDLTAEKFTADFPGEKLLYRTGDLARWTLDGNIEYLGRMDEQVKINGFRIELTEIENIIRTYEKVRDTVVAVQTDGNLNKLLGAYVTADEVMDFDKLKKYLKTKLPDYMIPRAYIQIDEILVNKNGKVDKRALPLFSTETSLEYKEPKTEQEKILAVVFELVTGHEKISMNDEFFRIGGDSIKAIRIISKLREKGYKLNVKDLMEQGTLGYIAGKMEKSIEDVFRYYQNEVSGKIPLTPIQLRFFENVVNTDHFNQALMLKTDMEEVLLRPVLDAVTRHHDVLRCTYEQGFLLNHEYEKDEFFRLECFDFSTLDPDVIGRQITAECDRIQRSFCLAQPPLFKTALFKTANGNYLFLCAHHLITDGVSWRILAEDIQTAYRQLRKDKKVSLPIKTISYKSWAEKLQEYAREYKLKKEREYWYKLAEKAAKIVGRERIYTCGPARAAKEFLVPKEMTKDILGRIAPAFHASVDTILITALAEAMKSGRASDAILFDLESYGRFGHSDEEVPDRTVGWFTSIYPLLVDDLTKDLTRNIIRIKEKMRQVPDHGMGFGILRYIVKDEKLTGLRPDAAFNYLGEIDNEKNKDYYGFSDFDLGSSSGEENKQWAPLTANCTLEEGVFHVALIRDTSYYSDEDIDCIGCNMMAEVQKICEMSLREKKEFFSASDFGEFDWTEQSFEAAYTILGGNMEYIYPMTAMQEGMLYHSIREDGSTAYIIQNIVEITSEFDFELCRKCMELLTRKYSVLRTAYIYRNVEVPRMIVKKEQTPECCYYDLRGADAGEREQKLQQIRREDLERGFDFEKDALMRITVVRTGEETYQMIWCFHHIIMDGWCISILLGDFAFYYNALRYKTASFQQLYLEAALKDTGSYGDYVKWLSEQDMDKAYSYWKKLLNGINHKNEIPCAISKVSEEQTDSSRARHFDLSTEVSNAVDSLASQTGVSSSTVFEAVWSILLRYYTYSEEVVYGKVVSGREFPIPHIEEMLGLFINTIPVKIDTHESTATDIMKQIQGQSNASSQYDYCNLAEILTHSAVTRDIIGSIYIFENYYIDKKKMDQAGSELEIHFAEIREETKYPITVTISRNDRYHVEYLYDTALYSAAFIDMLAEEFIQVTEEICMRSDKSVSEFEIVTDHEKASLLKLSYGEDVGYPSKCRNYVELFRKNAEDFSDKEAVICGNDSITYRELDRRSDMLAQRLVKLGVQQEERIVITGRKHVNTIVAMLAILKAGGAYVPVEDKIPEQRKAYILEDSGSRIVLTTNEEKDPVYEAYQVINVCEDKLYHEYANVELPQIGRDNLAYVIYTSGSSGQPKGVLVEHGNMLNLAPMCLYGYKFNSGDTVLQFASISFDQAVWDIFGTLSVGARICMVERNMIGELDRFIGFINTMKVTVAALTPTLLAELPPEKFTTMRIVESGGEAANLTTLQRWNKQKTIYNAYGPTEATVNATLWKYDDMYSKVSIGRPLPNTSIYIMNQEILCKKGVIGEICIGGKGVARGYLNREDLSKERFIKNPFVHGERLYRSGDLGRWNEDGTIECLGRNDDQVKIRGYRIETGEIEKLVQTYQGISHAAVVVWTTDEEEKYLCGYYTCDEGKNLEEDTLIDWLKQKLPEYMVPTVWVQIDSMPKTVNGKMNKNALPKPEADAAGNRHTYVAPRNYEEEKMVQIWKEVLNYQTIGVCDDFFTVGGHSLNAIRIVNRIELCFNVKVSIKDFFSLGTIEKIVEYMRSSTQASLLPKIRPAGKKKYYLASYAQKRLFMLYNMENAKTAYNMVASMSAEGHFDVDKCHASFLRLIKRHEVLRTSILMLDDEIIQIIHEDNIRDTFCFYDISSCTDQQEQLQRIRTQAMQPFALEDAPLIRMYVVQLQEEKWDIYLNIHHSVADGMSIDILMDDFIHLYSGKECEPLTIQYKDYSEWQQSAEMRAVLDEQEAYWTGMFSDDIPLLDLPVDFSRPLIKDFQGKMVTYRLNRELYEKVCAYTRQEKVTTFTVLLAVYLEMIRRYSRQNKILVGIPVTGRSKQVLERLVGMFVNTIVLKSTFSENMPFDIHVHRLQDSLAEAYDNQDYPFEELVNRVEKNRDMSRNPLFDIMFTYENNVRRQDADFEEVIFRENTVDLGISKFDLTLHVKECKEEFVLQWEYATSLFLQSTIDEMAETFTTLLRECVDRHMEAMECLENISADKCDTILGSQLPKQGKVRTVSELFDICAIKNPENTALYMDTGCMGYREFKKKVDSFAAYLKAKGIGRGSFIGILSEYSMEVMTGIYAVLRSGAAYVPINIKYPKERIEYILKDCNVDAVLVGKKVKALIPEGFPVIEMDITNSVPESGVEAVPYPANEDSAYVIYTSGTTGMPKGTVISHGALENYIVWGARQYFETDKITAMPLFTSIGFDLTVTTLFIPLITGNSVFLYDREYEGDAIRDIVWNDKIGIIKLTPAHLKMLNLECNNCYSIRKFILGGEELLGAVADDTIRLYGDNALLFNEYGPTEATVGCMNYVYHTGSVIRKKAVPIGDKISNVRLYIMNRGKLCSIGMPGELCIAGYSLAKEYFNKSELTEKYFITNPYRATERIYRTGDMARLLADGNYEYMGRMDEQIKLRSFRIELGEIESVMLKCSSVVQAAVIGRKRVDSEQYLCAYYVVEKTCEKQWEESVLKDHMRRMLPEYMIPAIFIKMNGIQLTANGKIDKSRLPEPDESAYAKAEYTAPSSETEKQLTVIWQEILGSSPIGIDDNFFELGGHSLKATYMAVLIKQRLGKVVPMKELFINSTVKTLAAYIEKAEDKALIYGSIPIAENKEYYRASSAQRRLYLISQMSEPTTAYNMPFIYRIYGQLDADRLQEAVRKLYERHEILRTALFLKDGDVVQKVYPMDAIHNYFVKKDIVDDDEEEALKYIRDTFFIPFDLSRVPLIKFQLVRIGADEYELDINMHHSVADGRSMNIMLADLGKLYTGGTPEALRIQYKDYSEWYSSQEMLELRKKQREFWMNRFEGEIPQLCLPTDYQRPAEMDYKGDVTCRQLQGEIYHHLKEFERQTSTTDFMVLFTAFMCVLSKYSSQDDIVIGTPIEARRNAELQNQLGMYTNTLAIRGRINGEKTFRETLNEMKDIIIEAYENQEYPFDDLVEAVVTDRSLARSPIFDVMFVLQNNAAEKIDENGFDFKNIIPESKSTQYDLTLNVSEQKDTFTFMWEYATSLFKPDRIERMQKHFVNLLEKVVVMPDDSLNTLDLMDEDERHQVLYAFNDTASPYADASTVTLFEEQAAEKPDEIAAVFEEKSITYGELNSKANRLAQFLLTKGVSREELVGLSGRKSLESIIGILGIMKAGAAYVPFDLTYPASRKQHIAEVCDMRYVLLSHEDEVTKENLAGMETCDVIALDKNEWMREEDTETGLDITATNLAYCIFTSGSTGEPKGVLLEHKGISNLKSMFCHTFERGNDRILQFANLTFDASVWEIFSALLNGKRLYLVDQLRNDVYALEEYIEKNNITMATFPTMYLKELDRGRLTGEKTIVSAGSEVTQELLSGLTGDGIRCYNAYGPTEATVHVCEYEYSTRKELETYHVPIGKPIINTEFYVMKGDLLCGIGETGELCIGGVGLAREYLKDEELTSRKFTTHPLNPKKKIYRTGDLVRWIPSGNVEFIGRTDNQVKIRGFRIEIGEVEEALAKIRLFSTCVVKVVEDKDKNKSLCAFYTLDSRQRSEEITIVAQTALRKLLPEYMIPSVFIRVDSMPINHSGKIDKNKLVVERLEKYMVLEYMAPRDGFETLLAGICAESLGMDKYGINYNFFHMGGDSIKAIRFISRLHENGYYLSMRDLMSKPEILSFKEYIRSVDEADIQEKEEKDRPKEGKQEQLSVIQSMSMEYDGNGEEGKAEGQYEMASMQKMFYKAANPTIRLKEYPGTGYGIPYVTDVIRRMIRDYEVLRYTGENGQIYMHEYSEDWKIPVYQYGIQGYMTADEFDEACGECLDHTQFLEGRLMAKFFIHISEKDEITLLAYIHHMIWDAMSSEVFHGQFSRYLEDETYSVDPETSYGHYIKEITEKSLHKNPILLMRYGAVRRMIKDINNFVKIVDRGEQMYNVVFSLKLDNEVAQYCSSNPINTMLYLLKNTIFKDKPVNRIPILLMYHGRNGIRTNYLDALGLFLDMIPVDVEMKERITEMNVQDEIDTMIRFRNKEHIHFMTMFNGWKEKGGAASEITNTDKGLSGINLDMIPCINYLGMYGISKGSDEIFETRNRQPNHMYSIDFNKNFAYFSISCYESLISGIQEEFRSCMNKIAQEMRSSDEDHIKIHIT